MFRSKHVQIFVEMRVSQTLLQTWHDHFARIYTSSHSFWQFSGHNLKCLLTISLYNPIYPLCYWTANNQLRYLRETHSEHLNSLEHTLNISTAWRVEPQSQDCPSLGVQKHLEEDGEACERGIQQPAMLTIWSLRWLASPIIWASAGWSEPDHGVDQWEHSGAKHGAALEYGCMNITYICSLD